MLSKRIIACLDVRDGQVVKGINFEGLRSAGDPAELARRYNREGIDELVILDITATIERRRALADTIRAVARELFIPLAVGGGIHTEHDGAAAIDAGAEDVTEDGDLLKITTAASDLAAVRSALEDAAVEVQSAELSMEPKTTVEVGESDAPALLRMMDALEEHDDVDSVHANFDVPEEILEKAAAAS